MAMKVNLMYVIGAFALGGLACSKSVHKAKSTYDVTYTGEKNYLNFYIVDTITISEPVRIHSPKFGGQFIVSRALLQEYDNSITFFLRPDVFLLGDDLYRDLSPEQYPRYTYPDRGGCEVSQANFKIEGLEVYEFKTTPKSFILGLINANYFYVKHNAYSSFSFPETGNKITYYKTVYPLCK